MKLEENKHTRYSPSMLQNIATCPMYVPNDKGDVDEEDLFTPSAIGTRIHEALEIMSPHILLSPYENRLFEKATESMTNILVECATRWHCSLEELTVDREVKIGPVEIADELVGGTIDAVISGPGNEKAIIDYKTGSTRVPPPKENAQLFAYAYLYCKDICTDIPRSIILGIVQPTTEEGFFLDEISCWDTSMFEETEKRIYAIISLHKRCKREDNINCYHVSLKGCMYCGRLAECPKVFETARSLAYPSIVLNGLPDYDSPEGLGETFSLVKLMEVFSKQAKDKIRGLIIEDGRKANGYIVSKRAGIPTIAKDKFLDWALEYISSDELIYLSNISFSKVMDKVIKIKAGKKQSKKELDKLKEDEFKFLIDNEIITGRGATYAIIEDKSKK